MEEWGVVGSSRVWAIAIRSVSGGGSEASAIGSPSRVAIASISRVIGTWHVSTDSIEQGVVILLELVGVLLVTIVVITSVVATEGVVAVAGKIVFIIGGLILVIPVVVRSIRMAVAIVPAAGEIVIITWRNDSLVILLVTPVIWVSTVGVWVSVVAVSMAHEVVVLVLGLVLSPVIWVSAIAVSAVAITVRMSISIAVAAVEIVIFISAFALVVLSTIDDIWVGSVVGRVAIVAVRVARTVTGEEVVVIVRLVVLITPVVWVIIAIGVAVRITISVADEVVILISALSLVVAPVWVSTVSVRMGTIGVRMSTISIWVVVSMAVSSSPSDEAILLLLLSADNSDNDCGNERFHLRDRYFVCLKNNYNSIYLFFV